MQWRQTHRESGWIVNVDEHVLQPELARHMRTHRRRAVALGCMVATCDVSDAAFARVVGLRLGDFTGDEHVGPGGDGGFEVTLRASGTERDMPHRPIWFGHQGDGSTELLRHMLGQLGGRR